MLRHFLSVDLESAHHAGNLRGRLRRDSDRSMRDQLEQRVVPATRRLLAVFRQFDAKACFFVLGSLAERFPGLLGEIASEGHRIAAHGHSHRSVPDHGPGEWNRDLAMALESLRPWEAAWQGEPGYRAPNFSLPPVAEAYHQLKQAGFHWSSSLMGARLPRAGRAALPGLDQLLEKGPEQLAVQTPAGPVAEFPLAGTRLLDRLPLGWGGGFWLRALPFGWNLSRMRSWHGAGRPFHVYLHPWELDLEQPRVQLPLWRGIRQYRGMDGLGERLEILFSEFRFRPCGPEIDFRESEWNQVKSE